MNNEEITSLAREYAEWVTQQEGDKAYIPAEQAIASAFLHWLTRRFCLVEKEKAQQVKNCINTKAVEVVMNLLFPDLAK